MVDRIRRNKGPEDLGLLFLELVCGDAVFAVYGQLVYGHAVVA